MFALCLETLHLLRVPSKRGNRLSDFFCPIHRTGLVSRRWAKGWPGLTDRFDKRPWEEILMDSVPLAALREGPMSSEPSP